MSQNARGATVGKETHLVARIAAAIVPIAALLAWLALPLAALGQDEANAALVGEYAVTIHKVDVPQDLANGSTLIGSWRIAFKTDGTYTEERQDVGVLVTGSYKVDGDKVTLTDKDGLLSCSNPDAATGDQGDVSEGTYQWSRTGERLALTVVEDNCALRRVLLSTREFDAFVACLVQPLATGAGATPGAGTPVASPVAESTPETFPSAASPEASPPAANADIDQAIDDLLKQMTSCWNTGDPNRFLPLMSDAFRQQFLQSTGGGNDPVAALGQLMQATTFQWERAGDVDLTDPTHPSAIVRQKVGDQEDFVRYTFVFEHGGWRWNGTG
jgi:hypothetical protein